MTLSHRPSEWEDGAGRGNIPKSRPVNSSQESEPAREAMFNSLVVFLKEKKSTFPPNDERLGEVPQNWVSAVTGKSVELCFCLRAS